MTDEPAPSDDVEGPDRLITLTDGVVAIAMTLLALDLKPDLPSDVSSHDLGKYFTDHLDPYLAFVLAFGLIAQYWLVHHRLMRTVTRHDDGLTWANMLFLFGITLLPLTSYITGTFGAPLATSIFAGSLVIVSGALTLMSEVILRRGLAPPVPRERRLRNRSREVTTLAIPLAIAVLAWFVPHASYLFFLFFLSDVPGRMLVRARGRRHATVA